MLNKVENSNVWTHFLKYRARWPPSREVLQNEFRYDFRKCPREISAGTVFTVFTCIINRSLIWQHMRGIHAYLRKAPSAIAALPQVTLRRVTTARTSFHYTAGVASGTWISPRNAGLPRWILLIFGMLLVKTLINFWSSFYKNDTVRFQEIPISVSCCLSEIDHLPWMTCLSTSTRAGRWRPKSRFYALNIGSQSPWDNFFRTARKNIHETGCSSSVFLLSRTVRGIVFHRHIFRNVAVETARMRCQMRLLLAL